MTPCDRLAEAVVSGLPLTTEDRAHLEGCAACRRLATLPDLLASTARPTEPRPGFSARMMVATRARLGQRRRRRIAGFTFALAAAAASAVAIDRKLIQHHAEPAHAPAGMPAAELDPDLRHDLDLLREEPMAPTAPWERIEAPIHRYRIVLRKGGSP